MSDLTQSFAGTDGAAPPAPWTIVSGTAAILSNRLRVTSPAVQWNAGEVRANQSVADGTVSVTFNVPVVVGASPRLNFRWDPATGNGYRVIVGNEFAELTLLRVDAYTETTLQQVTALPIADATDYLLEVTYNGSTIEVTRWAATDAKPATPTITATDATYTTGDVSLVVVTSTAAATSADWSTFTLDDLSNNAPASTSGLELFSGAAELYLWDGAALLPVQGLGPAAQASTAVTYTASTAIIPNPGRGFFQYSETHYQPDGSGYSPLSSSTLAAERTGPDGRALVFRYFVLEKFLGLDTIDQAYLDLVAADLAAVRAAGCKAVIRFTYSTSGDMTAPYGADPEPARVLSHIAQLAGAVNAHADVVEAIEAGFIGMWGEWYYTDHFGDLGVLTAQNWADRQAVIDALLDNLDPGIFVLVRYPGVKQHIYGLDPTGARAARIGFHNDAFLAADDDWGTFSTFTALDVAGSKSWLAGHTGAAPMGGETANLNSPRSDFPSATTDLQAYHWTFLNPEYHPDVLASWGQTGRDEVARRLGYRLRLVDAALPVSAAAGASVRVQVNIANDGYSAPYRNSPVEVVFTGPAGTVVREVPLDPRTLLPGQTSSATLTVKAPDVAGTYAMHLSLPDAAAALRGDPSYSMQLANAGVWDGATGWNSLGGSLVVA